MYGHPWPSTGEELLEEAFNQHNGYRERLVGCLATTRGPSRSGTVVMASTGRSPVSGRKAAGIGLRTAELGLSIWVPDIR